MSIHVTLFGAPRIEREGAIVRFDTRKAIALLAVLALTDRAHSRDSLATMLWPDLDRSRARAALRRTLSVASTIAPALVIEADRVSLDADAIECDVHRFRKLARADDPRSWQLADELASAPLLDGFSLRDSDAFDDWQVAAAESLQGLHGTLLARLAEHHAAQGDLVSALHAARRRVEIDPLSEPAHVALMLLEARNGDRSAALQTYRRLVRMLDSELGVAPLPETLELYDDIRADRLSMQRAGASAPPAHVEVEVTLQGRGGIDAPAPLAGREEALIVLRSAWDRARDDGAVLGIVGEPGMGKTAVIEQFARDSVADGVPLIRLAGHAAEQSLAYAGAHDLVRSLLALRPDIVDEPGHALAPLAVLTGRGRAGDESIGGPGDLHRVHEAVRGALVEICAARPVVLVVDDAHRLDRPTAALIGFVARRPPRGLLLIAAWVPAAAASALPRTIVESGRVCQLDPLDPTAIRLLVESLRASELDTAELDEIVQRTRGIPLLVREYATIASAVDGGARELVAVRYDTAFETTRQVVAAAAIIGTVADPELLRQVAGRDELETVDALDDGGYDLPHELVRTAALARLSLARTRLLHARAAEHLARRLHVDDRAPLAGVIAQHWSRAGRDTEAARWFALAAHDSSRMGAHLESLEQWRAALAHGGRTADVHEAIGTALVRLGRYAEAIVSFEQAAASTENDPGRLAGIERAIAGVHDRQGDAALAQSHLREALALLEAPGDADSHGSAQDRAAAAIENETRIARIMADLALMGHRRGDDLAAAELAAEAERRATAAGDLAAHVQATNVLGVIAMARGDHSSARHMLERAAARARELADPDLLIAALNNLARAVHATGDLEGAIGVAHEARSLAERQGDLHRLAAVHSLVADLLHAAGRDDEAMAELKSSAAAFADVHDAAQRPEVWTLTEW